MAEFELLEAEPGERDQVIALLSRCFASNAKVDAAVMDWQYWSNPFGQTRSWVAKHEGRIVAHHAAYTIPVRFGDRHITAAIQVDTATDPEFRGHGLYGKLSRALYTACESDGVAVMFGNPNESAIGPLRRAGWVEISDLRLFVRLLDPLWIARRSRTPRWLSSVGSGVAFPSPSSSHAVVSDKVPLGLEDLVDECRRSNVVKAATGERWWTWRFESHPLAPYFFLEVHENGSLAAAAACGTRTEGDDIFVDLMDLVARTPSAARSLVDGVTKAVPDAARVLMTTNADSSFAAAARWAGLRLVPRRLRSNTTNFGVNELAGVKAWLTRCGTSAWEYWTTPSGTSQAAIHLSDIGWCRPVVGVDRLPSQSFKNAPTTIAIPT